MAIADDWKKMPLKARVAVVAVLFILIIVAYWFYLLGPVMAKRAELGRKIQEIDEKIAVKGRIAAQKPRYLQELKNWMRHSGKR